MTQRDGNGEGGGRGFRMGNMYIPVEYRNIESDLIQAWVLSFCANDYYLIPWTFRTML